MFGVSRTLGGAIFAALFMFISCTGTIDPESAVQLASSQNDVVILDPGGGDGIIRFTAAHEWYVDLSDDSAWLSVSSMDGEAGMCRIEVEAERNLSGAGRAASLTICSGTSSVTVKVEQDAFVATFELPVSGRSVSAAGTTFVVKVNSDVKYDIDVDADWLSLYETKAVSDNEHVFKAEPNPYAETRTARITFSYGEDSRIYTVTQRPAGTESEDWKHDGFVHRSLAMRFTADWCGYCPYMALAFETARNESEGMIELVSLHGSGSSLEFPSVSSLISRFGVNSFPTGNIDARANIPNYSSTITTASAALAVANETAASYSVTTGIACDSHVSGSELTVELDVYAKKPDSYRVTILLLEDAIIGYQNNGGDDYRHDHVARLAVTSINGDSFTIDAPSGAVWSKSYTVQLKSGWNQDNLRLLVYVEKPYGTQEIVRGVKEADYGDFGSTYVDNCRSVSVGEAASLELE